MPGRKGLFWDFFGANFSLRSFWSEFYRRTGSGQFGSGTIYQIESPFLAFGVVPRQAVAGRGGAAGLGFEIFGGARAQAAAF